jgi:DNA (cytosine-5)-methyltransferase 1
MKYFSMFSGVGGFENGIYRAVERIKASRKADIAEYCPVFKSGDEERGLGTIGDNNSEASGLSTRKETASCIRGHLSDDTSEHGRHGTSCIGFSEIDKYAIQIYQRHFPEHKNYGDATLIDERQLPDFDLLVGGFPCQAFSVAGKRQGFNETRGTLFFDIARILSHKRPRHFLLENVKGLLSHDSGKTFQTIIRVLTDIGYCVEWQVLNSKDFGVPQNRERVFIIGHLGIEGFRAIFPIGESNGNDCQEGRISNTLTSNYWKGVGTNRPFIKETQRLPDAQRIREIDGCSVTLKGEGGGQGAKTGLYAIPDDTGGVFDGYRIRRLTPVECARLQGFPDDWHEGVSDSQAYRCYGNAVTVNVIEAIMMKLLSITEQ